MLEIDQLVSKREAAALTLAGCEVRRLETEFCVRHQAGDDQVDVELVVQAIGVQVVDHPAWRQGSQG